jgi:hypothetical protein
MAFAETAAGRLPQLKHHLQFVTVNQWADFNSHRQNRIRLCMKGWVWMIRSISARRS